MTARSVTLRFAPVLALVLTASMTSADRLRLESGGELEASAWWVEGETLYYDGGAGTIGIPRSLVIGVERDATTSAGTAAKPEVIAGPQAAPATEPPALTADAIGERLQFAAEALERREFSLAADTFESLLRASPEMGAARIGAAVARLALSQDVLALGLVLDGLVTSPNDPRLLELLGDLRNREERVDEALGAWRSAFGLAPDDRLREKILKGERELHAGRSYDLLRTAHFNAKFDGELDRHVAQEMIEYLEEQFWDLSGQFRHVPSQVITVLLYPDTAFRDVTQSPDWVGGVFDGKIRVPLGGLHKLDPRAREVLRHELTHAIVHSKTRGNCPRWLHEGLAQYAEGRAVGRAERKEIAFRLERVDPANWEAAGFSYPMALSLTRYLFSRRGAAGIVEVLDRLEDGQTIDDALRGSLGEDHAGICRRWAASVKRGVWP